MTLRLTKLLGNGSGIWLRLQQTLDLGDLARQSGYESIGALQVA